IERPTNPGWNWIAYDPILVRKNMPGFVYEPLGVRINRHGFRGEEIRAEKPPGAVRIFCLGDSTTFGIWLERPGERRADTSYPAELERLLVEAGDRHVEV